MTWGSDNQVFYGLKLLRSVGVAFLAGSFDLAQERTHARYIGVKPQQTMTPDHYMRIENENLAHESV